MRGALDSESALETIQHLERDAPVSAGEIANDNVALLRHRDGFRRFALSSPSPLRDSILSNASFASVPSRSAQKISIPPPLR